MRSFPCRFALFPVALLPVSVFANDFVTAVNEGEADLSFRYRYELVDDEARPEKAHASTLKSRLTLTSQAFWDLRAQLEFDHVAVIGNRLFDDLHHSQTERAVVADNQGAEVNQAWLAYNGLAQTGIKYGRQRINYDNQRFIGGVGWRQNEQTYDGIRLENSSVGELRVDYAYVTNVNRVFGPEDGRPGTPAARANLDSRSHLLNVNFGGLDAGALSAYAYLLDFDEAPAMSGNTLGLRFAGERAPLKYQVEYARQRDYGDQTLDYDASYYLVEAGLTLKPLAFNVGLEVLGSDNGRIGFAAPLATGHTFNGWADRFLVTPANGLEDLYVALSGTLFGGNWQAAYHQFEADEGNANYGDELDLSYGKKLNDNLSLLLKYASYRADSFSVDVDKFWLQLQFQF